MDDFDELRSPSNALKLKYDIKRMVQAKWAMIMKDCKTQQDREAAENCKIFLELMDIEYSDRVVRVARTILARKLYEGRQDLPSPNDVKILTEHLKSELVDWQHQHISGLITMNEYRRAAVLLQTRLLLHNKRRSGELEAIW